MLPFRTTLATPSRAPTPSGQLGHSDDARASAPPAETLAVRSRADAPGRAVSGLAPLPAGLDIAPGAVGSRHPLMEEASTMPTRRVALALVLTFLAIAIIPLPALAADCGGATPCACGDTVTASRVLTGADPVTSTSGSDVCVADPALTVQAGVTLDLGGRTIRCSGPGAFQVGINTVGSFATVTNGTVTGCFLGVVGVTLSGTPGSEFSRLRLPGNDTGLIIFGDDWTVDRVVAADSLTFNLVAIGNGHVFTSNRCESSLGLGLGIVGNGNRLENNFCQRNGGDGIFVLGTGNHLASNQGRTNGGFGVFAAGGGNTTNNKNYGNGNALANCLIDGVSSPNGKYC
jgi:hypothetical protein